MKLSRDRGVATMDAREDAVNERPAPSWVAIWAAMLAVYIVWGSTYLAIRFAVETMPPFLMAGIRFLVAGSVLYAFRRARGDAAPTPRHWRSAAIIGLFLLLGGNGGVVWAEQRLPSSLAALLVGTVPLWMVVIEAVRPGGQRAGWRTLVGAAVGFAGITLLVGPGPAAGTPGHVDTFNVIILLFAALSWSIGSLYSRKAALPDSPLLGTSLEMLAGGLGLLLLGIVSGELSQLHLSLISARSLIGLLYLITFGSWVGFGAYTWLLRVAPTSLVSTYAYVNPVVAVFMGFLLGGEIISGRTLLAAAIIIGSVAIITTFREKKTMPVEAPPAAVPDPCRSTAGAGK